MFMAQDFETRVQNQTVDFAVHVAPAGKPFLDRVPDVLQSSDTAIRTESMFEKIIFTLRLKDAVDFL